MKIVIVGGVAGGASAAARIRRLDEHAEIIIFEKSGYVSYANCGLPYYIGGVIMEEGNLTLQTPASFKRRFNIDVHVRHEVVAVNCSKKTISVKNLDTGAFFEENYDKLVLSPGAKPVKPDIPGVDSERLFTLRTVEDALRIRAYVEKVQPKTAVVAGGGFIGLELAENLTEMGVKVTVVQKPDHLLNTLDADMASFVHAKFRQKGVDMLLGTAVTGFEDRVDCILTHFGGEHSLCSQMVVLAIGVAPDSVLAKEAGLTLGVRGSIAVDEHMRTSDPDIYAVGDAVQVRHGATGGETLIALAGPANKQGRIAADNICGIKSSYRASFGSSIIKIFDMTAASTGMNEKAVVAEGLNYEKIILSPASHASYYPGGKAMTMKLLYEKESLRILGAQIVGFDGVDKRIDVIATAMQAGMKVTQLKELDLAYAPPFSSAKDPVNMAGFMAENIENGILKQFHFEDVDKLLRDGSVTLLDSRTPGEYARGHVEGFMNIPVDELRQRIGEIERGKPVYVMCQSGLRSYISTRILEGEGFEAYNFSGGYRFYESVRDNRFLENTNAGCGIGLPEKINRS